MRRALAWTWVVVATAGASAGCRDPGPFSCATSDACVGDDGSAGYCEPTGFCSFGDPSCASMRRYGTYAGADLAETCVVGGPLPALVQQKAAFAPAAPMLQVALSSPPRDGDALILCVNTNSSLVSSVRGGGVTWAMLDKSTVHTYGAVWAGFGASAGTTTVVVTLSAPGDVTVGLSEWSGIDGVDVMTHSSGAPPTIMTGNLTTTKSNDLVFACAATGNIGLGAPDHDFTALDGAAVMNTKASMAYRLAPRAETYETTWTELMPSGWDALLVAFRPSGG